MKARLSYFLIEKIVYENYYKIVVTLNGTCQLLIALGLKVQSNVLLKLIKFNDFSRH